MTSPKTRETPAHSTTAAQAPRRSTLVARPMHSLSSSLRRAVSGVVTRVHVASCLPRAPAAASAGALSFGVPALARSTSTLAVTDEYVRRSYPFPTILESDIPGDFSKFLYYDRQFPTDLPVFKSKLTVDIRDLGLDPTSRMAMREIVGSRYNTRTHQISFVSRHLPTAQSNENRVFQQLDACLVEARDLAKKMNADGVFGNDNGARHNRLLTATPTREEATKSLLAERKRRIDRIRAKAGLQPIHAKKEEKAATKADKKTDGAAPAGGKKPRATHSTRNAKALGMTEEQRRALAQPTKAQLLDEIIRAQQPTA